MATINRLHSRGFDRSTIGREEAPGSCYVDVACSQCAALVINGVACHESGCPNALPFDCFECGSVAVRYRHAVCEDCANPEPWDDGVDEYEDI
jgi:hypothetical protein